MLDYKFGFNVYNYPPEDLIEYAAKNNLHHIEINTSLPHSSIESFSDERIAKLNELSDNSYIDLSLHIPNQNNIADNISFLRKSSITYLEKAINLGQKLNVKFINCHMGFFFWFPMESYQRKKSLNRFIKNLFLVLEECEKRDVTLTLENVSPLPQGSEHLLLGDNIEDMEFVFSKVNSKLLKFCLDTGHANLAEGTNNYLDIFAEKLHSVHYHDNLGDDDSHLNIGDGNIEWEQLAKKLNELNFKGPFISECRNHRPHEAARKLSEYLNKSYNASPLKS